MTSVLTVPKIPATLVEWFRRGQPLAVLSASAALAVKAYSSVANTEQHLNRRGQLIDSNV